MCPVACVGLQLVRATFWSVRVTRLLRAGVEMPVVPSLRLQYGDSIVTVGDADQLKQTPDVLGNSRQALNHPEMLPDFIGIALGAFISFIISNLTPVPSLVEMWSVVLGVLVTVEVGLFFG